MAPERKLRLDRNAAASTLAQLARPAPAEDAGRHRLLGLLVEAQRQLKAGDAARAEHACRTALRLAPDHADALNLLSAALGRQGRAVEAERCSRRALAARPDDPGFWLNLGNRLQEQGRLGEAVEAWREGASRAPGRRDLLEPLLAGLGELGRRAEALAVAHRLAAAAERAGDGEALARCAQAALQAPDLVAALGFLDHALIHQPDRTDWRLQLARIAQKLQRLEVAVAAAEAILEGDPAHEEARLCLASCLLYQRDLARMAEVLTGLPEDSPHAATAANLRGMMLVAQGRIEDGLAAMAATRALAPDATTLQMTRIMYLNYDPALAPAELRAEHAWFGQRFAHAVPPVLHSRGDARDPERPLRVGYLSPDFRVHSVAYFMAPVLEAFDRARCEVLAYAHVPRPDLVTEHLRPLASAWRDVTALDDGELAQVIADDRVDILVDLAGLTKDSRLLACTARPAPVQIGYLGYPNTAGLPQLDYRITDWIADPEGFDEHYTETLIRLPRCFLCYAIPQHAPEVGSPPVERTGRITFGSFNNLAKLNGRVVALWAELLRSVPGSRLLLKATGTGDPATGQYLRERFAAHGIGPERLELAPYAATPREHLAAYDEVDLALDPFPYNGTTTTCEALWMGVPVVTLAGDRHAARVGASLLASIGFDAGIATSAEDYLRTARLLAENPALLATARRHLRSDLCRSPLCDMYGHARALEEAYRAVWRIWCEEAGR